MEQPHTREQCIQKADWYLKFAMENSKKMTDEELEKNLALAVLWNKRAREGGWQT